MLLQTGQSLKTSVFFSWNKPRTTRIPPEIGQFLAFEQKIPFSLSLSVFLMFFVQSHHQRKVLRVIWGSSWHDFWTLWNPKVLYAPRIRQRWALAVWAKWQNVYMFIQRTSELTFVFQVRSIKLSQSQIGLIGMLSEALPDTALGIYPAQWTRGSGPFMSRLKQIWHKFPKKRWMKMKVLCPLFPRVRGCRVWWHDDMMDCSCRVCLSFRVPWWELLEENHWSVIPTGNCD